MADPLVDDLIILPSSARAGKSDIRSSAAGHGKWRYGPGAPVPGKTMQFLMGWG